MAEKEQTPQEVQDEILEGFFSRLKKCPHCNSKEGLRHYNVGDCHTLHCTCGWYSRAMETLADVEQWYNTRGGKKPKKTEVKVEHKPNLDITVEKS